LTTSGGTSSIAQSYATGAVTAGTGYAGGLVGSTDNTSGGTATITQSYATGSVTGNGSYVGGLVGSVVTRGGTLKIEQSYSTGSVTGRSRTGGLVGYAATHGSGTSNIAQSYATGMVTGTDGYAGGLVGYNFSDGGTSNIAQSYATGTVTGTDGYAGGLVGYNFSDGGTSNITQSYATAAVMGSNYVGGLVGSNDVYGIGTVSITQSYATGAVTGTGSVVGGLVGRNYSANGTSSITQSYATGTVTGTSSIGGLVGQNAVDSVGGTSSIGQSYATGVVAGVFASGGLVGSNYLGTYTANFWDTTTTGLGCATGSACVVSGTTGLTTAQFQNTDNFMALASAQGWDFETVWTPPSAGYYPELYALSSVVWVKAEDASRTYGGANPTFAELGRYGGPSTYVFGPAGDTLGFSSNLTTAANAQSNVGSYAITGTDSATSTNGIAYRVVYSGALTVNRAALTITASDASKTYGQVASLSGFTSSALQNGETIGSVVLTSDGAAATASVAGGPYAIVASGASGGSFDANNYAITYVDGALTVNRAALTITASDASKTYGQVASLSGFTSSALQNGETIGSVVLTSDGAAAPASVAGGPYAIVASGASGGSFDANNYAITYVDGALTVNRAALTITASDASKTYGQVAGLSGFSNSALQNGETIGSVVLTSDGAAAAASVAGGPYAIVASSATGGTFDANNYAITYVDGGLTVNRAALTITASDASKTHGQVANLTGFTSSALQNGETIGSVVLASDGAAAAASVAGGPYAIVASSASGGTFDANNYAITYVDGDLTVNRAALTYLASPAERSQHATNPPLTGTVSGFANGEDMSVLSGTLAWTTDADANSLPGQFAINGGGLSSDNYVFVQAVSNTTALTIRSSAPASPAPRFVETQGPDDWAIADRFDRLLLLLSGDGSELDQCADRDGEASNCAAWPHPANLPLGHGLRISAG